MHQYLVCHPHSHNSLWVLSTCFSLRESICLQVMISAFWVSFPPIMSTGLKFELKTPITKHQIDPLSSGLSSQWIWESATFLGLWTLTEKFIVSHFHIKTSNISEAVWPLEMYMYLISSSSFLVQRFHWLPPCFCAHSRTTHSSQLCLHIYVTKPVSGMNNRGLYCWS